MGEGTADGRRQQRGGEHEAAAVVVGGRRSEAKPAGGSQAVIEDANSQRVLQEPVRAGIVVAVADDNDDQIESSLFGAQNPGMGSSSQQEDSEAAELLEDASNHLFTDAMKLQLRAQILVLGDLLKGIAPNPDWLEDACLESAIGAESVLSEPIDIPRGAQDVRCENPCIDEIPAESDLLRISSAFRDAEARMSPFSGAADLPTTRDAMKDELHSAGRVSAPREPSSSGKEPSFRDDSLAQETDIAISGQLLITYDHTPTARSNSNVAEDSRPTEICILDNDKHLDLAQASAQDALTTATSALAQSHMVWARLHSQDHSEEGIARDARLASVAATVAAASSVAKAAVEAARAIAEVSMDAFIQAGGYQLGDIGAVTPQFGSARSRPLQVDGWERSPYSNTRENATPSQQRAEMLESVVQAAGKAAEAATQAGAVLAKANPMIQTGGLSGFWSRKSDEADGEHEGNAHNVMNEANEMDAVDEVDALNEMDAVNELDGANAEDAVEEMEDIEEGPIYQDKLDAVNDVHEQDIADQDEAVEDEVAAVNGDEVPAADEDGVFGVNEVAEPFEQEKRTTPRSRKSKRGRGRSRGVSSRTKKSKISIGVPSSPKPAQSPDNAMRSPGKDTPDRDLREPETDANTHEVPENIVEEGPAVQDEVVTADGDGVVTADGDGVVTADGDGVVTADGDGVVTADGDGVVGGNEAGVAAVYEDEVAAANEDGVFGANEVAEPVEQEKRISPRSRKFKRGRGRTRGVSSRAKRSKISVGVPSPPIPAQSPDNAMHEKVDVSESLKDGRDENARWKKLGAKHTEITPVSISGEDTPATAPAQGPDNAMEVLESQNRPVSTIGEDIPATALVHGPEDEIPKQDNVSTSRKNARGKRIGKKHIENRLVSTTGEDILATAPAQSPENEVHKQDDVSTSRKSARGKKLGAKHIENTTVRGDIPATAPAQSPENEVRKQDDVLKSRKNLRGKKRGAKNIENTLVSPSGEDIPASALVQSPENERHKKDDVPKSRKNVQVENAGGRTRGAGRKEDRTVSTPGKDTADRDFREPETDANTHEVPENTVQEGSAVEVMIDEVGLRGAWFSGRVLRMAANEVFVELLDLLTDDGKSNVREWFPIVEGSNPHHPRRHARPVHPFTIFSEAGSRKRRRVALGSQTWHRGDQVDAFIQDAWWEGIIAELNDLDPTKATVYFPEENDTQVVKTWDLRPSFQWQENKWMPCKNPTLVEEEERPQKRHRTGGPNEEVTKDGPEELTSNDKSSVPTTSAPRIDAAQGKTPTTKGKPRRRSKRYP